MSGDLESIAGEFRGLLADDMQRLLKNSPIRPLRVEDFKQQILETLSTRFLPLPDATEYLDIVCERDRLNAHQYNIRFGYSEEKVFSLLKRMTRTQAALFELYLEKVFSRSPSWEYERVI